MVSWDSYRAVCERGLSSVRPMRASASALDHEGWNFGQAWPPSYFAYGRMRALLTLDIALALQPQSVLEVAAGDGALCASLKQAGARRVVANDLRGDNLRVSVGQFTNAAEIEVLEGNLFDLAPERTGLFELVVAAEIIEHVAHAEAFLRQLRRFVASGGRLLISTPNGDYFRNRLPTHSKVTDFTALEARQFQPDADGHLFLLTDRELTSLAAAAGFEVESRLAWGTPAITGHCRSSILRSPRWLRTCHRIETWAQRLPLALRRRLAFNLIFVMRAVDSARAY
jgi:2-polyprenyl-6-hydroxyphenyl methylase/3-demethylubiquinone-9 3-methyltransferase